MLLHGTRSWPRRIKATYVLRALSPSPTYCWRALPTPFWCSAWLRGDGTQSTPSTLLTGRWRWLLMTFTGWSALGAMGRSLTWGCFGCAARHWFALEEVLDGYDPLIWNWDGLQASPTGDSWWLCSDGEGLFAVYHGGVFLCQWGVDGVSMVAVPLSRFQGG